MFICGARTFATLQLSRENKPNQSAYFVWRVYLFVQQLLVFSGITEEDVRQLGPNIFVLEVTDLREPYEENKKQDAFNLGVTNGGNGRTAILTFSARPAWSSPSALCLGRTCSTGSGDETGTLRQRQKMTKNDIWRIYRDATVIILSQSNKVAQPYFVIF